MNRGLISIYCVFSEYPLGWLKEALNGVREQTYKNMEFVFVCYGQKDMIGMVKALQVIDFPYKFFYRPELDNFISAIRFAISKCQGEYLIRADAEDKLLPNAIEQMYRFAPNAMIIPNHITYDSDGNVIDKNVKGNIKNISSNCLIRWNILLKTKYHKFQTCRDGLAIIHTINKYNENIYYLDIPLFYYRQNYESITNNPRNDETIKYNTSLVDNMYNYNLFEDEILTNINERYSITTYGRVYSHYNGKKRTGKFMKEYIHNGYSTINMYNTKHKTYLIHRLVAETFISNPENKTEVNHKDGNKLNNHIDNLEWCTSQENNQHAQDTGLNLARKSIKQKTSVLKLNKTKRKLTLNTANIIRTVYKNTKISQQSLAKKYNVSQGTIKNIINNKTYLN